MRTSAQASQNLSTPPHTLESWTQGFFLYSCLTPQVEPQTQVTRMPKDINGRREAKVHVVFQSFVLWVGNYFTGITSNKLTHTSICSGYCHEIGSKFEFLYVYFLIIWCYYRSCFNLEDFPTYPCRYFRSLWSRQFHFYNSKLFHFYIKINLYRTFTLNIIPVFIHVYIEKKKNKKVYQTS